MWMRVYVLALCVWLASCAPGSSPPDSKPETTDERTTGPAPQISRDISPELTKLSFVHHVIDDEYEAELVWIARQPLLSSEVRDRTRLRFNFPLLNGLAADGVHVEVQTIDSDGRNSVTRVQTPRELTFDREPNRLRIVADSALLARLTNSTRGRLGFENHVLSLSFTVPPSAWAQHVPRFLDLKPRGVRARVLIPIGRQDQSTELFYRDLFEDRVMAQLRRVAPLHLSGTVSNDGDSDDSSALRFQLERGVESGNCLVTLETTLRTQRELVECAFNRYDLVVAKFGRLSLVPRVQVGETDKPFYRFTLRRHVLTRREAAFSHARQIQLDLRP